MKIKKIFTKRIALQLINMGNRVLFTEPNKKYRDFIVFVFKDTDKLQQDLQVINVKH